MRAFLSQPVLYLRLKTRNVDQWKGSSGEKDFETKRKQRKPTELTFFWKQAFLFWTNEKNVYVNITLRHMRFEKH